MPWLLYTWVRKPHYRVDRSLGILYIVEKREVAISTWN
jgi:hypothetical protein